ncbi:membrane-spanning 4-domains subfamily A member 4A [Salmo salar]|uniref:Membrane-spanning 4-domains subfamily A member 4A n=1 Tax=Salmo salar TaxID=8030 RepID=A0A1S3R6Z9_SALSA|nr:membrane-spanning 4-domains subfamily A member 4A [Salmo salar]|eukprot:XP_014048148.1 PREDICTED: membrane-spanning 4-domains subfamily A member 4A-like [Salmo salar]
MSSSQTTTTNGVVVITHVYPNGNGVGVAGVASTPHCLGQTVSSVLGSFRAGHPKALGTIQIMIGLMVLLTGIVMTAGPQVDNIGVLSGIFVWGSIIYVVAGSLTVAADNKLDKCLVKGSLGMNVVATVTALTGTILHSLDSAGILYYYYCDNPGYPSYYPPSYVCQQYWVRSQGISGVLAVFSLLEFIVSICVSSFACRAVCLCCCSTPEQVFIIGNQIPGPHGSMTTSNAPFPPQNNNETGNYPKGPEGDGMGTGFQQNPLPPQYTAVIP